MKLDPDAKFTYSGPDSGVGQKVNWQSKHRDVGVGSQEIIESVANKRIETRLDFGPEGTAASGFDFNVTGGTTNITWRFKTDVGYNSMMR